ncbi:phage terminase large subunit [Sulfurimonas sp.]|uniref:phage terminase large subunit n=1 Tax=Sulfurimonas sp. TaxID=2022749 RepID=UPI0025FFA90F|nr:phage terminase large subunit [Sulfurimonas sp.]
MYLSLSIRPMQITLTEKQTKAFDYLEDKTTKEILFGGSAGSAKSFTGCLWQLLRRLAHPNTRGLIGRAKLTDLKNTTLMTFFEVANMLGVNHKFKYNAQNNRILFNNGSIIFLKDLFLYPSDPEFVSLGSMEITDCFIDEAGDVCEKAYTILRTRIRYNLINGVPKMALGANPAQNWLYREFYKPFKDGTLPNDRKFVPSTARENKYIPHEYLISLDKLKGIDRERLRNGNWDYEDDNTVMIPYDAILGMFGFEYAERGQKYISADIALGGADLFVVGVWDGLQLLDVIVLPKCEADEVLTVLKDCADKHQVPYRNIVFDGDGVGGYLRGFLRRSYKFNNGSSPIIAKKKQSAGYLMKKSFITPDHANLKTQCAYRLADLASNGEIGITLTNTIRKYQDRIQSELQQLKRDKVDNDSKLYIISKEQMKENLAHSPDFLDMMIMRMVFELEY